MTRNATQHKKKEEEEEKKKKKTKKTKKTKRKKTKYFSLGLLFEEGEEEGEFSSLKSFL